MIKLDSCSVLNIKATNMLKFSLLVEALNKLRQDSDGLGKGSGGQMMMNIMSKPAV